MNIQEFRKKHPQYDDIDDLTLSKKLHKKFYSDLSFEDFNNRFNAPQELSTPVPAALPAKSEAEPQTPKESQLPRFVQRPIEAALAFRQGLRNISQGITQAGATGLGALGLVEPETVSQITKDIEAQREAFSKTPAGQSTTGKIFQFAGEVLPYMALGPLGGAKGLGARALASGLMGGAIGGTQFVPGNKSSDRAKNIALGAGLGAAGGAISRLPESVASRLDDFFLSRASKNPIVASAVYTGTKEGVPVFRADIASPTINKTATLLENAPVGMIKARLAQNKATKEAAERLLNKSSVKMLSGDFGGKTGLSKIKDIAKSDTSERQAEALYILDKIKKSGYDWNKIIQTSGNVKLFKSKLISDNLYDKVEALSKKYGPMKLDKTRAAIASVENAMGKDMFKNKNLHRRIKEIKKRLFPKKTISYSDAKRAQSEIKSEIRDQKGVNAVIGSRGTGYLAEIKNAIRKDMDDFANIKGDDIRAAWKKADTFYKNAVVPAKSKAIAKALRNERPDEIYRQFIKTGRREDAVGRDAALELYNALDDKGKAAVRYGMISDAYEKGITTNASQDIVFSPAKFASSLEKIAAGREVFFKGRASNEIKGFINLMRTVQRSGQVAENPPTGNRLVQALALGATGVGAAITPGATATTAAPIFAGLYGLQKLLTTDAGRKLLTSAARVKEGSSAAYKISDMVADFIRNAILTRQD